MSELLGRIRLPGEYLDSYIYSGVLYLATSNGGLHAFAWESIVNRLIPAGSAHSTFRQALLDSRQLLSTQGPYPSGSDAGGEEVVLVELEVDPGALQSAYLSSIEFAELPTDWSIFSNRLYTASEAGVEFVSLAWERGFSSSEHWQRLFDGVSLKVSPNTYDRCAVAAGPDGLLTFASRRADPACVAPDFCWDCDWQEQLLVGSSDGGAFVAEFIPISGALPTGGTDWTVVNSQKSRAPIETGRLLVGGHPLKFTWLGGDRLFGLDDHMRLYSGPRVTSLGSERLQVIESLGDIYAIEFASLYAIRSAPFGTVAEFGERLLLFSGAGAAQVSAEVGRWRVFPRAKNYANHLHVIKDDHLEIACVTIPRTNDRSDRLGYSWDAISSSE